MAGSSWKAGYDRGFKMDYESFGCLGELFSSLHMCHNPSAIQNLTTINAPCFLTCRNLQKGSQGSEIDQRGSHCLKFTLALADNGACDKSLRIIVDLLELIGGCKAGCQLSHRLARFLKSCITCLFGLNITITGTVRFYGMVMTVDLLPLLL